MRLTGGALKHTGDTKTIFINNLAYIAHHKHAYILSTNREREGEREREGGRRVRRLRSTKKKQKNKTNAPNEHVFFFFLFFLLFQKYQPPEDKRNRTGYRRETKKKNTARE